MLSVWDICQFVVSSKLFCCSVAAHPFHIESPSLLVLDEEKKKQLKEKFNVLSDTKVSDVMREMLQMTLNDISYLVARENVCVCVCVCVFFCVSLCACPCVCGFLCALVFVCVCVCVSMFGGREKEGEKRANDKDATEKH